MGRINHARARKLHGVTSPGYAFEMGFTIRFSPKLVYKAVSYLIDEQVIRPNTTVYDPFLGNGTILYCLGIYFPQMFSHLYGSDQSEGLVRVADSNLQMTNPSTLRQKIQESAVTENGCLTRVTEEPESRKDRLASLLSQIERIPHYRPTQHSVFRANVLHRNFASNVIPGRSLDYVIADPPYCRECRFYDADGNPTDRTDLNSFARNMVPVLRKKAKLILFTDPEEKPRIDGFRKIHAQRMGNSNASRNLNVFEMN